MRNFLAFFVLLFLSCGTEKPPENPTTCQVEETSEGVKFVCVDKDGKVSSGIVKNGERGAAGQPGQPGENGEVGKPGSGLEVVGYKKCGGTIEGWMENSGYEIEFRMTMFATGDQFLSAKTKLVRSKEVINERTASMFYVASNSLNPSISDGQFQMVFQGTELQVKSQGGLSAALPCEEGK